MARKKGTKAAEREARARGLDQETFVEFTKDIGALKREMAGATTAHAQHWKETDRLGIHRKAAKIFLTIDREEEAERTALLRAFDLYRSWAPHWDAQADLLDHAEQQEEVGDVRDERTTEREEPPLDLGEREEPPPVAEVVEAKVEPEKADPIDDTKAEVTEELANAGYTFADGKGAGYRGDAVETNPHPEASPSHPIWARGHALGVKEKVETDSAGDAAVTPISSGRRIRREVDAGEASTAVH